MNVRPLACLWAAALLVSLPGRAAVAPFGPSPPVVHPGPPRVPTDPDRWLPWRVFTWRDGVKPINPPLAEDAQGYIWADGPVRYDGRAWQRIEVPGGSSPLRIWSLLAASDGSLWFGRMDGGLLRLQDRVWTRYGPGSGVPAGLVGAMVEEDRSTIWVGTASGLARCREGRCAEEAALRGTNVRSLAVTRAEDGRPALWIGTDRGLLRLDGIDGPSPTLSGRFEDQRVLPDLSIRSLAETVSPEGERSLWVATDGGVARLRNGEWTRYDARSGFPAGPVVKLVASRSPGGRPIVWAGSFLSGVIRFEEDGRWTLYDTRSGLPANYIYNLIVTRGGTAGEPTLWATTPGGVARLERERWIAIDAHSGLPNENILGLGEATFPDGLHTYWIGTVGGMVRLTRRGWERFSPSAETSIVFTFVEAREADGSAAFWMGTTDGLRRFAHGRWTSFTSRTAPLPYYWIWSLLAVPGKQGTVLWAGTVRGVVRYESGTWTLFQAGSSGLPGNEVRALVRTPSPGGGSIVWAATDRGLGRFAAGRWETVAVPCLPDPMILSLHLETGGDGAGWMWIGTPGGVARVRIDAAGQLQQACEALTEETRPALSDSDVLEIQADAFGRLYLFTHWGVNRLTPLPGRGLAAARLETFDTDDGLPGMEFNRTSFVDHLGRVWGGTIGGAAVLDPLPPETGPAPPAAAAPLRLERILVAGHERPLPAGTELRHDEGNLEFHYVLLSYRREHATRYRTQLLGLEERPSPWVPEAQVVYNRLPEGEYTFRVWGRDGDGTISGPVEARFRIRPPPWRTSWAIALYAAALIGLGYAASLLRSKALARRAATLEAQVAERTRELGEANRKLELASLTDPLTGLSNRRFLALNIGPDARQAVRQAVGTPAPKERNSDLIFYFLDVDHFKQLNDRTGHAAGDQVLVEIAVRLREAARDTDAVVRWGGEEFLVVSRWADRRTGETLAARLLEAVGGAPFAAGAEASIAVTCSVGWAPYPWRPEAPGAVHHEQVMGLADRALYMAKREGRNRAVGALPGPDGTLFPAGPLAEADGTAVALVRTAGPTAVAATAPAGTGASVVGFSQDSSPSWNR
ncbi:MAG TPA: diguanylate cyclase [Thermoanaerobaculia bacterium]|jgi:diguanylate cyclase (GGDEF)-like protein